MNTAEKLFAAMRANPHNWHLRDLQTVAKRRNMAWHMSGSHCVFKRWDGEILSIPVHRTVKAFYLRQFILFAEGM